MGEKIAELLVGLVLPGGGTIAELFSHLYRLAEDMRSSSAMCLRVLERIVFLYKEVEKIQNDSVLKNNDVLLKLATTITHFKTFMEVHSKKSTVSRYLAHREVADQILAFSSDLDTVSLALALTSAAENARMQTELSNTSSDLSGMRTKLTNTNALMKEYPGRKLVEMLNEVQFAIERNKSPGTPLLTAEDVAFLQRTMDVMVKQSNIRLAALPPWYLPSDCIQCPVDPFAIGTYGSVHRGTWNGSNVVIKKLLLSADDSEVEKKFRNEVEIWHKIGHHRHVIQLYGACDASTPPFFVCEDATHGDFVDFFGKSESNKRQMWRRFYEAALGVAHLHANKVVHGNLKCRNLLIGADGLTKVCDFGFGFIRSQSVGLSTKAQTDAVRWKALECLMGEEHTPQSPLYKSDVYSLGMCIIEAASGDAPWGLDDDDTILDSLLEGMIHPRPDGLTDKQWNLVTRMSAIDVSERMSLSDALIELRALAAEEEAQYPAHRVCPKCQVESRGSAKFCHECGHTLDTSRPQAQAPPDTSNESIEARLRAPVEQRSVLTERERKDRDELLRHIELVALWREAEVKEQVAWEANRPKHSVCGACGSVNPLDNAFCCECGEEISMYRPSDEWKFRFVVTDLQTLERAIQLFETEASRLHLLRIVCPRSSTSNARGSLRCTNCNFAVDTLGDSKTQRTRVDFEIEVVRLRAILSHSRDVADLLARLKALESQPPNIACDQCGELNPVDEVLCRECGFDVEIRDEEPL